MTQPDVSQWSMEQLFGAEAEAQTQVLTDGLLALERNPGSPPQLEACMRAAHSLKGAARIVDLDAAVGLAHAMEEVFVGAQAGRVALHQDTIDILLRGVDLMRTIASVRQGEPETETERRQRSIADSSRRSMGRLRSGSIR